MKNSSQADDAVTRMRANELNVLRTVHSETTVSKIALAVDALQRDRGLSHFDAYWMVQKNQPALFR